MEETREGILPRRPSSSLILPPIDFARRRWSENPPLGIAAENPKAVSHGAPPYRYPISCHVHKCNTRFLTVRNEEVAGKAPLFALAEKSDN